MNEGSILEAEKMSAIQPKSSAVVSGDTQRLDNRGLNKFFRTKSPDELISGAKKNNLNKTLTAFDLVILGVGAVIGAGIFALTGTAAAGGGEHVGAGPALVISLILAAVACSFAALCYAEFASMIPVAGSAFTYTYATLGELAAWFIGWMLVLEYLIGNITVVSSWSGYLMNFLKGFSGILPAFITDPPLWLVNNYSTAVEKYKKMANTEFITLLEQKFQALGLSADSISKTFDPSVFDPKAFNPEVFAKLGFQHADILLNPSSQIPHFMGIPIAVDIPVFLIMSFIIYSLYIGIKESARMTFFMVLIKTFVILLFLGVGAFYVQPENWTPFAPNGIKGIFVGAYLMFFAYIGFDAVSTAAEETKNPQRDMPIGIIGSLAICTLLYIGVAAVLTGVMPLNQIDTHAPISAAMSYINQNWVAFVISVGAIAGLTSVLLVLQLGGTRILYAMSREKLLPEVFSKTHSKFKTPHITTIVAGIAVILLSLFLDLNAAAELCNIGTLSAFMLVCIGIIVLRRTDPERERPFKVPFVPVVPIMGVLVCLSLILLGLPTFKTLIIFGAWIALGLVIYFSYSYKKAQKYIYNND